MDKEKLNDFWITFRWVLYAYLGVSFLLFLFLVISEESFTVKEVFHLLLASILIPGSLFFLPIIEIKSSWWHAVPMFIMLISLLGLIYFKIKTRKWLFILLVLSIWMSYVVLSLLNDLMMHLAMDGITGYEYSWWLGYESSCWHAVPMFIMLVLLLGLIYFKIETRKWLFIILALSIWMIYAVLFIVNGNWNWMAGVW